MYSDVFFYVWKMFKPYYKSSCERLCLQANSASALLTYTTFCFKYGKKLDGNQENLQTMPSTHSSFSHKDLGVKICPLPVFLILQGFGFHFNHGLAESSLCLVSHKAPKSKTLEVYSQYSGYVL